MKKRYFKVFDDYDNYAVYAATQTYIRLTDKRQFLPEDHPEKLPKIKSILNFIKKVMYPLRVNYQKEVFNEVLKFDETEEYEGSDMVSAIYTIKQSDMYASNSSFIQQDVENYIHRLHNIIGKIVDETPYACDKILRSRLYMSTLISFVKSVTLNNYHKQYLNQLDSIKRASQKVVDTIYNRETDNSLTAWRLDESYLPVIQALVFKIKKAVVSDINSILSEYESTDDVLQASLINQAQESIE